MIYKRTQACVIKITSAGFGLLLKKKISPLPSQDKVLHTCLRATVVVRSVTRTRSTGTSRYTTRVVFVAATERQTAWKIRERRNGAKEKTRMFIGRAVVFFWSAFITLIYNAATLCFRSLTNELTSLARDRG